MLASLRKRLQPEQQCCFLYFSSKSATKNIENNKKLYVAAGKMAHNLFAVGAWFY